MLASLSHLTEAIYTLFYCELTDAIYRSVFIYVAWNLKNGGFKFVLSTDKDVKRSTARYIAGIKIITSLDGYLRSS